MKQNTPRATPRKPAPQPAKRTFNWLTPRRVRTLIIIFLVSFVVSLVLELYVFGFPDGFFLNWFSAMFALFFLLTGTVLGIIPLVNYVANRWLRF